MSGARFYLDERAAGVALRDSQADPADGSRPWGEHAEGVIRICAVTPDSEGKLALSIADERSLNAQVRELNEGHKPTLVWAESRLKSGADVRAQAAAAEKERAFDAVHRAWSSENRNRAQPIMAAVFGEAHPAWCDSMLYASRRVGDAESTRASVEFKWTNCKASVDVGNITHADVEAITAFWPKLTECLRALESLRAERLPLEPKREASS